MAVTLEAIATPENFDETGYLAANPDVAEAVRSGHFRNGRQHFDGHGRKEGRLVRFPRSIADIQEEKLSASSRCCGSTCRMCGAARNAIF